MSDLPKIKKVQEIGSTPFKFKYLEEKILQGWDRKRKRMLYLFKNDQNNWCYYSNTLKTLVEVNQWKDKEAMINGNWVKMEVYFRVFLEFAQPVIYTSFVDSQEAKLETTEALVNLTKKAYDDLEEAMKGRSEESYYRFIYKKLKNGNQYVDGVEFVQ